MISIYITNNLRQQLNFDLPTFIIKEILCSQTELRCSMRLLLIGHGWIYCLRWDMQFSYVHLISRPSLSLSRLGLGSKRTDKALYIYMQHSSLSGPVIDATPCVVVCRHRPKKQQRSHDRRRVPEHAAAHPQPHWRQWRQEVLLLSPS
jgi:hypothetical protein